MGKKPCLNKMERDLVVRMRAKGKSCRAIAEYIGRSKSAVASCRLVTQKNQDAAAILIKLNGQTVTTAQKMGWRPKTLSGSLYFQTIKTRRVNSSDFSFFPPFEIAPMKQGPKPIWSSKKTDRFLAHLDRLQKRSQGQVRRSQGQVGLQRYAVASQLQIGVASRKLTRKFLNRFLWAAGHFS